MDNESFELNPELVGLKKQLGGFFLLHTLYWKQPYKRQNHIILDSEDLTAIKAFEVKVARLLPENIRDEYYFMVTKFKFYNAFEFQLFSDEVSNLHLLHELPTFPNPAKLDTYVYLKRRKNVFSVWDCLQYSALSERQE